MIAKNERDLDEKLAHGTIVMTDPFNEDIVSIGESEYEETLDTNEAGMMGFITPNQLFDLEQITEENASILSRLQKVSEIQVK